MHRGSPWTGSTVVVHGPGVHVLSTSETFVFPKELCGNRRKQFGVISLTESFTDIDNTSLGEIVREILHVNPRIGFRLVQGARCRRGITVLRRRILGAM